MGTATEASLKIIGKASFKFVIPKFSPEEYLFTFSVADNVSCPIVLGYDFIFNKKDLILHVQKIHYLRHYLLFLPRCPGLKNNFRTQDNKIFRKESKG